MYIHPAQYDKDFGLYEHMKEIYACAAAHELCTCHRYAFMHQTLVSYRWYVHRKACGLGV